MSERSTARAAGEQGAAVVEALAELPGGPELLEVGRARDDIALVGGAVRDLLLGQPPRELDVTVAGESAELAAELAARLPGDEARTPETTVHERFGTAAVDWIYGRIDIAERRAESYPRPGALPKVRPSSPAEDLARRDFTVNAIAVTLGGPSRGELEAAEHALEDLAERRLRVLHERSFLDDPTRLLRLARYSARLGFEPEQRTAQLAAEALRAGALGSVSPARIGAELRLALREEDPVGSLVALAELGVLGALDPPLSFSEQLARGGLAALPADGRSDPLLLASLLVSLDPGDGAAREAATKAFLDRLEFAASDRERATRAALRAPALVAALAAARSPSQLRRSVRGEPLEAIALAAAMDELQPPAPAASAARRWLDELRHVRLQVTGDDLLSAGVAPGPEVGRLLDALLDMVLDGKLGDSREAQLQAALGART